LNLKNIVHNIEIKIIIMIKIYYKRLRMKIIKILFNNKIKVSKIFKLDYYYLNLKNILYLLLNYIIYLL